MSGPRIVLYDLETLPNLPEALKVWTQLSNYPGQTLKASITSIICAGWKVLGSKKVECINAWDFPEWKKDVNDDGPLCRAIYDVLKDADCVVTHNGSRFDWPFLQTRLLYHGLDSLPKIHHVDTCKEAKRHLKVFNNRLNTIADFLTDTKKMEHEGWDLWVKVHSRDPKAMRTMEAYCKKDVLVLEEVFKRLRPLIKSLPNQNLFNPLKAKACPNCGSSRLQSRGKLLTQTRMYNRYHCQDCGAWSRTDANDEAPR
jgi:DNA polymerase elongation subunit (family B)